MRICSRANCVTGEILRFAKQIDRRLGCSWLNLTGCSNSLHDLRRNLRLLLAQNAMCAPHPSPCSLVSCYHLLTHDFASVLVSGCLKPEQARGTPGKELARSGGLSPPCLQFRRYRRAPRPPKSDRRGRSFPTERLVSSLLNDERRT